MTIRRFDHRARFRAAYLNNTIDQLNAMNRTRFYFQGQEGGNIRVAGRATYSLLYEVADYNFYCPPIVPLHPTEGFNHFWLKREAVPTWGHSGETARTKMLRAREVSENAAIYADDLENNGWGGYDLTGVTAETYGANYDPPGTQKLPCDGSDYFLTGDEDDYPFGYNWRSKAGDSAILEVFPDEPNSANIPGQNALSVWPGEAALGVSPQAVGFMYLLQSLPPGSVILDARIPVKLSNFSKWTEKTSYENVRFVEPYLDGLYWRGGMTYDAVQNDTDDPHGTVGFTMMGRKPTGTYVNTADRLKRATRWDVLSGDVASDVTSNAWSIIDLTSTCNAFLTDYKFGEYFSFVLFPSAEGTPIEGGASLGQYLATLPQRPPYQIAENPSWDMGRGVSDAKDHGHAWTSVTDPYNGDGVRQDLLWTPEERSWGIRWGSLMFGEGIIEFKYPDLRGKYITAKTIVRGDSPILG